jgi:hypothetical protein
MQINTATASGQTWGQSYNRQLQRRRYEYLQLQGKPGAFWKQKYFILL